MQAVAELADRQTREVLDRFRAQQGDGTASTGQVDVVARLQRGQVDTVLLVNDPSSTDQLWIAPDDPALISVDDHVLCEPGVTEPRKVRADAALVRAIAGTSAELVLVQPGEAELAGQGRASRARPSWSTASARCCATPTRARRRAEPVYPELSAIAISSP